MQCANHLKQLGLAIQNYHSAFEKFPGGGTGPMERPAGAPADLISGQERTAFVPLLPYIEEMTRFSIIQGVEGDPQGFHPAGDHACWKGDAMSMLRCPSDAGITERYTPRGHTTGPQIPTNYCFSEADFVLARYGQGGDRGNKRSPFGMHQDRTKQTAERRSEGYGYDTQNSMGSITDGAANTVLLSERCATPGDGSQRVDTIRGGVHAEGFEVTQYRPSQCQAMKGDAGKYNALSNPKGGSGTNFAYFTLQNGFFHTIIAPNGPSCSWASGVSLGQYAAIFPPTSYHPGGVNVAMADGSGRLITETINTANSGSVGLTMFPRPRQKDNDGSDEIRTAVGRPASFYGVWGALGSMNGRESSVSL
jgi:prepilin-type processing-associated H-X9-DG protein